MTRGDFGCEEEIELPVDERGFLRKECAGCHRQFKVRRSELDGALFLRRIARTLSHANDHEIASSPPKRSCPYCGRHGDGDEWWTDEQRLFATRVATSLSERVRFEQLRHVELTLDQNPYLTFLPVAPAPMLAQLRPEADDMRLVPMVCCGEELKIRETWSGTIFCPFCATEHETDPVRPRGDGAQPAPDRSS